MTIGWEVPGSAAPATRSRRCDDLPDVVEVNTIAEMRLRDPGLYAAWRTVISAIEVDALPMDAMETLLTSMPQQVQRDLVHAISGSNSSLLLGFRQSMRKAEEVLESAINGDGASGLTVKDAINLQVKLSSTMARDLPKFIKLENVQRTERALTKVMESHLTKAQQRAVLAELDRLAAEEER